MEKVIYIFLLLSPLECAIAARASRAEICNRILATIQTGEVTEAGAPPEGSSLRLGFRELPPYRKLIAIDSAKGTYTEMVVRRYSYEGLITEVMTTEKKTGEVPDTLFANKPLKKGQSRAVLMTGAAKEGFEEYLSRVHELIEFAIQENSVRGHYNRKLYRTMGQVGDRFWSQFEYVSVHRQEGKGKKGELLGTWRLDWAPYKTVRYPSALLSGASAPPDTLVVQGNNLGEKGRPALITQTEWHFSKPGNRIRFPRPAVYRRRKTKVGGRTEVVEDGEGRIAEISALAVKAGAGLRTHLLVMTHLVASTIDPAKGVDYNTNGQFFYGAVDDLSITAKRGMTPQKYWRETKKGWVLTDEPIERDGVKLKVVGGTSADVLRMITNLRQGFDRLSESQEDEARQLLEGLIRSYGTLRSGDELMGESNHP